MTVQFNGGGSVRGPPEWGPPVYYCSFEDGDRASQAFALVGHFCKGSLQAADVAPVGF